MKRTVTAVLLLAWAFSVPAVARIERLPISVECEQEEGAVVVVHKTSRVFGIRSISVHRVSNKNIVWSVRGIDDALLKNGTIAIGTELNGDSVDVPFAGLVEGEAYRVYVSTPGLSGFAEFIAEEVCISKRTKSVDTSRDKQKRKDGSGGKPKCTKAVESDDLDRRKHQDDLAEH